MDCVGSARRRGPDATLPCLNPGIIYCFVTRQWLGTVATHRWLTGRASNDRADALHGLQVRVWRVHHLLRLGMQTPSTITHAQMSLSIEGISAILQQSQAPNASQQSLHAAAQAFEQVHMTAASRFRTPYLFCLPQLK